ncbi:methyltransferase [Amycolatopsis sp. NPDC059657]|uniref:methyltransferase n=1 Tax=Amycolatopsis sp. NPDC059657 TaxID=3346899 RepID=UPI00366C590C
MNVFRELSDTAATLAAFTTAVQLGLLDRIDRTPATPQELARTCGASERGVRVVLAALAEQGFVELLADGRYRPLVPGIASLHPILPLWERLPEVVRTGEPAFESDCAETAGGIYPSMVTFLAALWSRSAAEVARLLPKARRVLDVGAGAAPWSIPLASEHCRVTALDLPPVLKATRQAVNRAGVAAHYEFLGADMFDARLDTGGHDLIVLGQVCHLFDEAACAKLLRHLSPALEPGGTFAVIETLAGSTEAAMHDLSLFLRTRHGTVHPPSAYRAWLGDAGLGEVEVAELPDGMALITARK